MAPDRPADVMNIPGRNRSERPLRRPAIMDITLFTDSIRCCTCNELDLVHGLRKRSDRWYCRRCLERQAATV
jgi:formylmethanofuran dehydrogenase subunit E